MSQAEELLNSVSEEIPVHTHPVPDTDTYFIIDPITRRIENTNRKKTVIMQYDHNSERFTFELPRYIDGHDMLECNSVTANVDNVEVVEPDSDEVGGLRVNSDAPDITDLRIRPNDSEKVICSWLISRNSTQLAGILSFHIEFKCVDPNGNIVYEWSTDDYDEIEIRARKKNGEAAVAAHSDLLEQWRTRIFGAGDSVMANIAAEGEAQVAAVKAESKTQQDAVELKGAQTLESIPEDYTEVDSMADEAVRSKGDAIVCEAAGESVVFKDSSNDHIRGLKLFGKSSQTHTNGYQLFDASRLNTKSVGGATVTNNGDGSFTVSGSGTMTASLSLAHVYTHEETVKLLRAGDVYFDAEVCTYPYVYAYVGNDSNHTEVSNIRDNMKKSTITQELLDDESTILRIGFYSQIGDTIKTGTFKPMFYQDGDGTFEPYTGGKPSPNPEYPQEIVSVENPSMSVCGKNLIPFPYGESTVTKNGVTFTVNDDGSIHLSGTATKVSVFTVFQGSLPLNGIFTLSGVTNELNPFTHYMQPYVDDVFKEAQISGGRTYEINGNLTRIALYVKSGETIDCMVYPQLEIGEKATAYEAPATQNINITRTLPGIPVTSGGNYTDSDGQQWICDEIDLERGVYVQRISNVIRDASSDEYWYKVDATGGPIFAHILHDALANGSSKILRCSHFTPSINETYNRTNNACYFYDSTLRISHLAITDLDLFKQWLADNPITVTYPLGVPIENPLTAEEIAAFKALRTNYPNTTILNDAGAWMSVKYNADTKTYVENPKTLKLVDSSTGVVYELKIVDGNLTINPV